MHLPGVAEQRGPAAGGPGAPSRAEPREPAPPVRAVDQGQHARAQLDQQVQEEVRHHHPVQAAGDGLDFYMYTRSIGPLLPMHLGISGRIYYIPTCIQLLHSSSQTPYRNTSFLFRKCTRRQTYVWRAIHMYAGAQIHVPCSKAAIHTYVYCGSSLLSGNIT